MGALTLVWEEEPTSQVSGHLVPALTIKGEISQAKIDAHTIKVENWVEKMKEKEKAIEETYDGSRHMFGAWKVAWL